jgi:hypothetical protein
MSFDFDPDARSLRFKYYKIPLDHPGVNNRSDWPIKLDSEKNK